jgi:hypothetical protein
MKRVLFACAAVVTLAAFTISPAPKNANDDVVKINMKSGTPLSAQLLGENEVPMLGDPDGMGSIELTLNQGQGTITYTMHVEGIEPARAAHIHFGSAGMPGPVVITLMAPTSGMSSGVIENVSKELIKNIRQNPEMYYVNVHNAVYPGGALRGQLSK